MIEKIKEIAKNVKTLFKETSAEVYVGAALGFTLATGVSFVQENARNRQLPLGFSEISSIEKQAEYSNREVGKITEHYAKLNDLTMKVFECWNISWKSGFGNFDKKFATELDIKLIHLWPYIIILLENYCKKFQL